MALSDPFVSSWTFDDTAHLLRRTMFGPKLQEIQKYQSLGMQATLNTLLTPQPAATVLPLNNYSAVGTADDTGILFGETWVKAASNGTVDGNRRGSMKSWMMGEFINQPVSLHQKMILFWHNHFSVEMDVVNDARFTYNYFDLLRKFALGNFKKLVREMSVNPSMLVYLNGSVNTKTAPDENYGRELQELFTLGKGPDSKYTEDDVKAAAKICTGFRHKRDTVEYTFTPNNHDTSDKKFSAFYGNATIKGRTGADGEKELDDLIDLIFKQTEVAKYIVRRLYRFFVYYDITDKVEKEFIEPLAMVFRTNNYEIAPLLRVFFASQAFFNKEIRGALIKPPIDLVIGQIREFDVKIPDGKDLVNQYGHWAWLRDRARNMAQDIGDPPNVSGWTAYYQFPGYHENWINADTLPKRNQHINQMVTTGYTRGGTKILADLMEFTKKLTKPEDPVALIAELTAALFAVEVDKKILTGMKTDILLDGQSADYYWTELFEAAKKGSTTSDAYKMASSRLQRLFVAMIELSEYQLA